MLKDLNARDVIDCRAALTIISHQLRKWVIETKAGGWYTHQLAPQEDLCKEIEAMLVRFHMGDF
jgi:hypothetical protein